MGDVNLSRSMAKKLRYEMKLPPDGFVFVDELLRSGLTQYTEDDVIRVVENCPKKRFQLQKDNATKKWKVRATQGHTQATHGHIQATQSHTQATQVTRGHTRVVQEEQVYELVTTSSKGDINLSKNMARKLRHEMKLQPDGYVFVDDLLHSGLSQYNEQDVINVVVNCPKKRFQMEKDISTRRWKVRATQGHTRAVEEEKAYGLIEDGSLYPTVVHGTKTSLWSQIRLGGLSRMGRQHIHFAIGMPGDRSVISGMPPGCDVAIFIDLNKAIKDGYKFYISSNKVILTPGDEFGNLPTKYLKSAKNFKTACTWRNFYR